MNPTIVGIGGGTASGKSTLAAALADRLADRALLVLHDRYYHPLPVELRETPWLHNFDHPDALDTPRLVEDLLALRAGRTVELPRYDYATHSRAPVGDRVEPREVVLVEGILVLADAALRATFDRALYVDAPDDVRLLRRIRRDLRRRGRTVDDVLAQYERTVRPMHEAYVRPSRAHADLVLDGTAEIDRLVDAALALLAPSAHRSRRASASD